MTQSQKRGGLSLVELVVVIAILVVLAAVVIPLAGSHSDTAREAVTRQNLRQLQDVILNRYLVDMDRRLPRANVLGSAPQLLYLFVNPDSTGFDPVKNKGWRGPYLLQKDLYPNPALPEVSAAGFTSIYGNFNDPTVLDGWGSPIVLNEPTGTSALLRSAGPNRILNDADDITLTLY